jgi:hypothetical protein
MRRGPQGEGGESMRFRSAWIRAVALVLCTAGAPALAEIDCELGNGDKVTGTLDPADETETFRFRVPEGAQISVKAKALKNGPSLDVALAGPDEAPFEFGSGNAVAITGAVAEESGVYTVYVSSEDLETTGDYSLTISWKSPATASDTLFVGAGESDVLAFSADAGSTVTLSVKPAKGSSAAGELQSLTPPEGDDVVLAGTKSKQLLAQGGDYLFAFANEGDEDGELVATAKVKPPKIVKRKIALTSRVIGSGNPDGDTAFASVLGRAGGVVSVPPIDEGEPGFELTGASVSIPANALPAATAIVIATAPDIEMDFAVGAGTTVFFGPEGAKFDAAATVTIPYDAAYDTSTEMLVIYTRDAKGKLQLVPPPYTFDAVAHTVSFATSHFSSFRAVAPGGTTAGLLTLASGINGARDVCLAFEPGSPAQPALYFVAPGGAATVIALRVSTTPGVFLDKEVWAGGGALTADGSPKGQFDFGGNVVSVYALSDGQVWVATRTQLFRVDTSGNVSRVAGTGVAQDGGDSGPALQATFVRINSVIVAPDETVYLADAGAFRIRVIDPSTQTITTYAGTGIQGLGGDGVALNQSDLLAPADMDFADDGGLYVADGARVRHLTPAGVGPLVNVTVAGSSTGVTGNTGDGGPLLTALFRSIAGISVYIDPFDPTATKLVVTDDIDSTVRVLDLDADRVTLGAGQHGVCDNAPDVAPGTAAIGLPLGIVGLAGQITFADNEYGKVRTRLLVGQ